MPFTFDTEEAYLHYQKEFEHFLYRLEVADLKGLVLLSANGQSGTIMNEYKLPKQAGENINHKKSIYEFNISLKIVHDLLDGINFDIKKKIKLEKKKDLLIYSYRVAGTVGLMMAKILKVNKKNSLKSAIDLGIAMQLTNISRDVVEDLNSGRSYIDLNFEEIKSTIALAENYYKNSFYSLREIPVNLRFAIIVARRVYRKIGHKILNKKNLEDYKNSGKIYVSNLEKIIQTFYSLFDLIKLFLINKSDDDIQHDHFLINEEINLDERI